MKSLLHVFRRYSFWVVFLFLEFISLRLFFGNHPFQESVLQSGFTEIQGGVNYTLHGVKEIFTLRKTNEALQQENARLRQYASMSYIEKGSATDVTLISDSTHAKMYTYLPAKVLYNTTDLTNNYLVLNVGKDEGVESGMGVIAPNGVVGIVKSVSKNFCSVVSVLHSQSKVSVRLISTTCTGSLSWDNNSSELAELDEIPSHVKACLGQSVVTSGFSLAYPPGIDVGYVVDIQPSKGENFQKFKIRFVQDFKSLDRVYVIKNIYSNELASVLEGTGLKGNESDY